MKKKKQSLSLKKLTLRDLSADESSKIEGGNANVQLESAPTINQCGTGNPTDATNGCSGGCTQGCSGCCAGVTINVCWDTKFSISLNN